MMNQTELTSAFFSLPSAFMTMREKSMKKVSTAYLKIGGKWVVVFIKIVIITCIVADILLKVSCAFFNLLAKFTPKWILVK